jgi:hypothetical protein
MNWDAIGAAAEILGASAVFASLIYLAIQIRGGTNQGSAQMFQSVAAEQSRVSDAITGDPENLSVSLKMQNGDELNRNERVRRLQLISRIVQANLAIQIAYDKGQIGKEFFGDAKEQIKEMFGSEHAGLAAKKYLERQHPNLMHSEIFSSILKQEEIPDGSA